MSLSSSCHPLVVVERRFKGSAFISYYLIKTGQMTSEIFKFESVDDDDGRRRTDDGPLVYYKLTL